LPQALPRLITDGVDDLPHDHFPLSLQEANVGFSPLEILRVCLVRRGLLLDDQLVRIDALAEL
jgi:hypothetical protein